MTRASPDPPSRHHHPCMVPSDRRRPGGGYPFEWVSNHQVLTTVHLNPLKTKSRTFTLPAGDKKTAVEAMEKRHREERR